MRKPDLSGATEVAAVVIVATAQREVQPAVTDSQLRMVSQHVFLVIFLFRNLTLGSFVIYLLFVLYCSLDLYLHCLWPQAVVLTDFNVSSDCCRLHIPC